MRDELLNWVGIFWLCLHFEAFVVLEAVGDPLTVSLYFGVLFGCMIMSALIAGVAAGLSAVFRELKRV